MADTNQRRAYIDAISAATRAFNSGYEMAIRSGAPDATATWQTSPEPFNVRYMLEYGRSIIAANCPYPNEQRPGRGLDQAILTSGEAFFRRHDLFACYKTQAP